MLKELIKKLARALAANDVPYMIIGGQAAIIYREPRFTNDIDITLGLDTSHLDNLLHMCKDLGLKILVEDPLAFVEQTMVLPAIDVESGIRVDLIFSLTEYERQAINRANKIIIDDFEVFFCTLEDIIILKVFSGRPRDLEDVKFIVLKNPDYNHILVADTLVELGKAVDMDLLLRFIENIK
jgi:predicted nucleotidyltransferase